MYPEGKPSGGMMEGGVGGKNEESGEKEKRFLQIAWIGLVRPENVQQVFTFTKWFFYFFLNFLIFWSRILNCSFLFEISSGRNSWI